jgi:hypothetical protein
MREMMQSDMRPAVPGSMETNVPSQTLRIERKQFTLEIRENPRGQFLRITEEVGGRRDAVVVPLSGVEQFRDALNQIIDACREQFPPE